FKMGLPLGEPMAGRFKGDLVTICLFEPLDTVGRVLQRLWLPWLGKRFLAATRSGDNIFTPSAKYVGRLFWPLFSDYRPYEKGLITAFDFHTYTGPGVQNPGVDTVKLDY